MTSLYLNSPPHSQRLILGAIKNIHLNEQQSLSDFSKHSMQTLAKYLLGLDDIDFDHLPKTTVEQLVEACSTAELADHVTHILLVIAVIEGVRNEHNKIIPAQFDMQKLKKSQKYIEALAVNNYSSKLLNILLQGDNKASIDYVKEINLDSLNIRQISSNEKESERLYPYKESPDPKLEQRFLELEQYSHDTLGYLFWWFYTNNNFKFPGHPDALFEQFAVAHDSTHLLSGADATFSGEIQVSTFTGPMLKNKLSIPAHVFASLTPFQLGFDVFSINGGPHLDHVNLDHYWEAFARGYASTQNIFDSNWDFWAVAKTPIEELRRQYNIIPVASGGSRAGLLVLPD